MPEQQWPDVMTVDDAAQYMQLDASTIRELLRNDQLPGKKVGRVWRLLKTEIDAYLRGEWKQNAAA